MFADPCSREMEKSCKTALLFMYVKSIETNSSKLKFLWDFPSGAEVKSLPSNAGGASSIFGQGINVPRLRSHMRVQSKYFKINELNFLDLFPSILLSSPPNTLDLLFRTLSFFQSSILLPLNTFEHASQ